MIRILAFALAWLWVGHCWQRYTPRDLVLARAQCPASWGVVVAHSLQAVLIACSLLTPGDTPAGYVALGLSLYVFGQMLVLFAARENPYFLPVIAAPPVVIRTGVYRHLRHPGYTGHIISATGIWLIWTSLLALVPLVLFAALLVWRARKEDALLA